MRFYLLSLLTILLCGFTTPKSTLAQFLDDETYDKIEPILTDYCYDCHGGGAEEGGIALDDLMELGDQEKGKLLWHRVFKQMQSRLMPPPDKAQLSDDEKSELLDSITYGAFGLVRDKPNPGRVTIRRLNRVEYKNTIKDLIGVDYKTEINFPEDDSGHGFDNMSDVLTLSPLLFEKYINAANEIVSSVVPSAPYVKPEIWVSGGKFRRVGEEVDPAGKEKKEDSGEFDLSYYEASTIRAEVNIEHGGSYEVHLKLEGNDSYVDNVFDYNRCELTFSLDGKELLKREFVRQGGKDYSFPFKESLSAGMHEFAISVKPLTEEKQVRNLRITIENVLLVGPDDEAHYVRPAGHERFFSKQVPDDAEGRRAYARELLGSFATRAYRRPIDKESLDRLVKLAETIYGGAKRIRNSQELNEPELHFEAGIAKAMTAILASPRFLFREESVDPSEPVGNAANGDFPLIDEYSLASRLSYFFWATMPDGELIQLADSNQLRENLDAQITRMLADPKAESLAWNYIGQWLKSRAVESIPISDRSIAQRELPPDPEGAQLFAEYKELLRKDELNDDETERMQELRGIVRKRFNRGNRVELKRDIRKAMRDETEFVFKHILKNDLSLLDLIDSDYTFLNEKLAKFYDIPGLEKVEGREIRFVKLPENSLRGGLLTQGTFLVTTSNPDRTSPVKRGLFMLENLLGVPISAPPPNIPSLEDAADEHSEGESLSLRKSMEIHRANPLCSSCHRQMDQFGLALENFNAMGRYREQEFGKPIDATATLDAGKKIESVRELKKFLVTQRQEDLYRCFTEKMMMYALGREVDYRDVQTVDAIVAELVKSDGKASVLINGIIHSAAFQRTQPRGVDTSIRHNGVD